MRSSLPLLHIKKFLVPSPSRIVSTRHFMAPITTGILIIGDEILKGQTTDTNSGFICRRCYELGVSVKHIRVVPDDISVIVESIREVSKDYDVVIASGGIGSTHDDMTFEAAAIAFEDEIGLRQELVEFLRKYLKIKEEDSEHPALKMASIPNKAKLNYGPEMKFPVVSMENVYFFPGVPELLQKSFGLISKDIFGSGTTFHTKRIFSSSDEVSLVKALNSLVQKHPQVTFGSYPLWEGAYYKTRLSLEASEEAILSSAYEESLECIPGVLEAFDPAPHLGEVYDKIQGLLERDKALKESVGEAFKVIDKCFSEYGNEEIYLCFNGGKDCIVTLHLVAAYVWRKYGREGKIKSVYIRESDPYPEVEEIMSKMTTDYNLSLITLSGGMKVCLQSLIDLHPSCKAMILGTRSSDPYSANLKHFSPTDSGWPSLIRVNPVLNWEYCQIWRFIRGLYLNYPSLYDRGFTSLGNIHNTRPNPHLRRPGTENKYEPAYMLKDETSERDGRD
eukprot:TRINITY_DN978_c0_g1_i1.p1 TRINITY_DN978_c0_g1~~TRINITY_DN978_c0_g1_i1.p1  ORF type:complete len:505 (-),score=98.78 TRINITY_DN978_c0_g1_i1:56-1570(-)